MVRCFLGLLLCDTSSYASLFARSRHLPAAVLHFSFEESIGLCDGGMLGGEGYFGGRSPAFLLGALGGKTEESVSSFLYRYQREGRAALCGNSPFSFALWNKHTRVLTLGGVGGARCYVAEETDGLWFSSEKNLLPRSVAVERGAFPLEFFKKTQG